MMMMILHIQLKPKHQGRNVSGAKSPGANWRRGETSVILCKNAVSG